MSDGMTDKRSQPDPEFDQFRIPHHPLVPPMPPPPPRIAPSDLPRDPAFAWTATAIISHAGKLVIGDRAAQHGDKLANHLNLAKLWSAFLEVPITAEQAAVMMVLLKVARTKTGSLNRDDFVDMVGYAGLAGEIAGKLNGQG